MNEDLKMVRVCLSNGTPCDEDPFIAEVGNKTHLFCCQKGFEESLKQFLKFDDEERNEFHNN